MGGSAVLNYNTHTAAHSNQANVQELSYSLIWITAIYRLVLLNYTINVSKRFSFSSVQEVSSIRTLGDSQCADVMITTDRECVVTSTTGSGNFTGAANTVSSLEE